MCVCVFAVCVRMWEKEGEEGGKGRKREEEGRDREKWGEST